MLKKMLYDEILNDHLEHDTQVSTEKVLTGA